MLLAERLELGVSADEIADECALLEGGLELDSIVLVEFMSMVEEHFGFVFDDDDLEISLFANPKALAEYIASVQASALAEEAR